MVGRGHQHRLGLQAVRLLGDSNLMTEFHARYGGYGVMIYWHVERGRLCVYSQLKSGCSGAG